MNYEKVHGIRDTGHGTRDTGKAHLEQIYVTPAEAGVQDHPKVTNMWVCGKIF